MQVIIMTKEDWDNITDAVKSATIKTLVEAEQLELDEEKEEVKEVSEFAEGALFAAANILKGVEEVMMEHFSEDVEEKC